MKVAHKCSRKTDLLQVEGRIDASSSPDLSNEINALIRSGDNAIVLDLTGVDYVSSAGLRVFLMAAKALAAETRGFALTGLSGEVMEVVKLTGFHQILTICESIDAALDAVSVAE